MIYIQLLNYCDEAAYAGYTTYTSWPGCTYTQIVAREQPGVGIESRLETGSDNVARPQSVGKPLAGHLSILIGVSTAASFCRITQRFRRTDMQQEYLSASFSSSRRGLT